MRKKKESKMRCEKNNQTSISRVSIISSATDENKTKSEEQKHKVDITSKRADEAETEALKPKP